MCWAFLCPSTSGGQRKCMLLRSKVPQSGYRVSFTLMGLEGANWNVVKGRSWGGACLHLMWVPCETCRAGDVRSHLPGVSCHADAHPTWLGLYRSLWLVLVRLQYWVLSPVTCMHVRYLGETPSHTFLIFTTHVN